MVSGLTQVVEMSAGYEHSLFLTDTGSSRSCYGCGSNAVGQLASTNVKEMSPVMIDSYIDVDTIEAGPFTSLLLRAGQWVKIWGMMPDGSNQQDLILIHDFNPAP